MSEIKKVILPAGEWVDVNTKSSIPVGTHLTVQNTSTPWVYLAESDTSPDGNTFYKTITNLGQSSAEADVLSGALRLWAKSSQAASAAVIAVQEV